MSELRFEGVRKDFGKSTAVMDFNLAVEPGEAIVLLGPSGCGKTTTLRMVAGFERPTAGTISIGDKVVAGPNTFVPPEDREVGVVFQSYALWPHMTVEDNIGFGMTVRRRRVPGGERRRRVEEVLEHVQLTNMGKRYPHELSGGQQQRVALARALVTNPKILLLDEPLSNLDTRLREDMRLQVRQLQRDLNITMIYITHDRAEALALADRVVALKDGRAQQVAPPTEMYRYPRTRFVAMSMGSANFVPATVTYDGAETLVKLKTGQAVQVRQTQDNRFIEGQQVLACIRPADIELHEFATSASTPAVVQESVFLGDEVHYLVAAEGLAEPLRVIDRAVRPLERGAKVGITVGAGAASLLDDDLAGIAPPIPAAAR